MVLVSETDTRTWARAFLAQEKERGIHWRRWRGDFYRWQPHGVWQAIDDENARALFCACLSDLRVPGKASKKNPNPGPRPLVVANSSVRELEGAMQRECVVGPGLDAPTWLSGKDLRPPIEDIIPFTGGYLDLKAMRTHKPTQELFNLNVLPFAYESSASAPTTWLAFLSSVWPGDDEAIQALQEWFGYCLTADTREQRMLLLIGAKGSGKGTIARTLRQLCGEENTVGAGFADLGRPFGLESWIGKSVAIFPDARLQGRTDNNVLLEKLLSIVGQDPQTIDRKYASSWRGILSARVTLIGNLIPEVTDNTGALKRRLIALQTRESFEGREDKHLGEKIEMEMAGILNWALEGLQRFRMRGGFVQPQSGQRLLQSLDESNAPVRVFAAELLELGDEYEADATDVWQLWEEWREDIGQKPYDQSWLGRELEGAFPKVERIRKGKHPNRKQIFKGLRLRENESPGASPKLFTWE